MPDWDEGLDEVMAEVLGEPYKKYWHALGHFLDTFSRAEYSLVVALRHYSKVDAKLQKAVFGALRVAEARDALNRMFDANGATRLKARLKPALDHFGEITKTRNDILHWGATRTGDDLYRITNENFAHTKDKLSDYTVTPRELDQMGADLLKITFHLIVEIDRDQMDRLTYRKVFRPVLRQPWLYKPPQRAAPNSKRPDKRRGPKRQPQSSQASPRKQPKKAPRG